MDPEYRADMDSAHTDYRVAIRAARAAQHDAYRRADAARETAEAAARVALFLAGKNADGAARRRARDMRALESSTTGELFKRYRYNALVSGHADNAGQQHGADWNLREITRILGTRGVPVPVVIGYVPRAVTS